MVSYSINEAGEISGDVKGKYIGYNANPERAVVLKAKDGSHWKERLEDKLPDVQIEDYSYQNLDNANESFIDEFKIACSSGTIVSGDHIYFQPVIYSNYSENKLKSETRNYPVDFNYPISENLITTITIPKGYKVEELPKGRKFFLRGKAGAFTYACEDKGDGTVQVMTRFDLKQTHFEADLYKNVREIFSIMEQKMNEQIVLIKE